MEGVQKHGEEEEEMVTGERVSNGMDKFIEIGRQRSRDRFVRNIEPTKHCCGNTISDGKQAVMNEDFKGPILYSFSTS